MDIVVDKRVELMQVIQTIDNYWDNLSKKFFNTELFSCAYKENVRNYFKKYENHETVQLFRKIANNIHYIDSFIDFALCYSDPPEFNPVADPGNNLLGDDADFDHDEFIKALRRFYEDAKFESFFQNNQNEYEKLINDYKDGGETEKCADTVNAYLGNEPKDYEVLLSVLTLGNFGIKIRTNKNTVKNYSLISSFAYTAGKYVFGSKNDIAHYLWHEISHLTINDLTKKYIGEFNLADKTIPEVFVKNFYTDPEAIVNEYIIRAITNRLFEMNHEEKFMEIRAKSDIQKGFTEVELLREYIAKNCETDKKLLSDERYKELMDFVIKNIFK